MNLENYNQQSENFSQRHTLIYWVTRTQNNVFPSSGKVATWVQIKREYDIVAYTRSVKNIWGWSASIGRWHHCQHFHYTYTHNPTNLSIIIVQSQGRIRAFCASVKEIIVNLFLPLTNIFFRMKAKAAVICGFLSNFWSGQAKQT